MENEDWRTFRGLRMRYEQLQDKIIEWATDRGIIEHSTAQAQFLKAVSEMGELADALAKGREHEVLDAVGDVQICLVNMCAILGIDTVDCLEIAWRQIKDRRGHMVAGGVFVKEDDAPKA